MVKLPGTLKHLLSGKFFVIWALGFFCLLVYMYTIFNIPVRDIDTAICIIYGEIMCIIQLNGTSRYNELSKKKRFQSVPIAALRLNI